MKLSRYVVVVIVFALIGAAEASGAERFADPNGSGVICSEALPCKVNVAVNQAVDGDEIIVNPGTHTLGDGEELFTFTANLDIHGVAGQPKPILSGGGAPSSVATLFGANTKLTDIRIEGSRPTGFAVFGEGSDVNRVEVRISGEFACAALINTALPTAVIRNTLCHTTHANGRALTGSADPVETTVTVRNSTLVASGAGGRGIRVSGSGGGGVTVTAVNTIVDGGLHDVETSAPNVGDTARVNLTNSNFSSIQESGAGDRAITFFGANGNQSGPPLFVDAANGDFHQTPNSPTIDAGLTDAANGQLDLDGAPRVQGASTDIGAYEYDSTPPETTIDSGPPASSTQTVVSFTYSSPDAVSFQCTLDGNPVACVPAGYTTPGLAVGSHTFTVAGVDANGNVDPTPASRTFEVVAESKTPVDCSDEIALFNELGATVEKIKEKLKKAKQRKREAERGSKAFDKAAAKVKRLRAKKRSLTTKLLVAQTAMNDCLAEQAKAAS